jgi:hypothetical protein
MVPNLRIAGPIAVLALVVCGVAGANASGGLLAPRLEIVSATHHCGATPATQYFSVDFKVSNLTPHNHYLLESNYKNEIDGDGQLFDFTAGSATYSNGHAHLRPPYAAEGIPKMKLRVTFIAYNYGAVANGPTRPSTSVSLTLAKCR